MTLNHLSGADLASAIAILKALLAGEVSREAVAAWCEAQSYRVGAPCWPFIRVRYVESGFDKRRENHGRFVFNNLLNVNATVDNGPNQEPYFLRTYDLEMMLHQLESDGAPHRWKSLVEMPLEDVGKNGWREVWLVSFRFPTPLLWPQGLWSYRCEGDAPNFEEYCCFYFQGQPFRLARAFDGETWNQVLDVQLFSSKPEEPVASEPLVALLKELGLSWSQLDCIKEERFCFEPHALYRYDDNGGEYLMERFNSFLAAEMTRQMYEDRGHKQIYYLKRETDPVTS